MLVITQSAYQSLRGHGEQTYPQECCGVLLATVRNGQRRVERAVACANARTDRRKDRYDINPRELIAIQREARAQGFEVAGFYHSHPDHPAQWSQSDLAGGHWLGCWYVITSVEHGKAAQTNAFLLQGSAEEDKHFEEDEIKVVAQPEVLLKEA